MSTRFTGRDGAELVYRELGEGRPLVLLHGLIAQSQQWIDTGIAETLAAAGHRVIMPDLRGHGESSRSHDPAAYPPDVLAQDCLALVEQLGLDDYDLCGYSLGGRVVLRMLALGARPGRAIVAGQGRDALDAQSERTGGHRRVFTAAAEGLPLEPGSAEAEMARWVVRSGNDPVALRHVLDTFVATGEAELRRIDTPTLVLIGTEDHGRSAADELAAALPNARLAQIPGDHMSAFLGPDLAPAILGFLDG